MKAAAVCCAWLFLLVSSACSGDSQMDKSPFLPAVHTYVEKRASEFAEIPDDRQAALRKVAAYVRTRRQADQPVQLTFICTHNSRRSHLSQIWAAAAAAYYGIDRVETFSGGTEATAFNPRAVAALERAGLKITKRDDNKNARYDVRFRETDQPLVCFSKVYNETPNPVKDFCAIMTCSQADTNCPVVQGASLRIAIPYDDPKIADDTQEERARYDERCRQICREMLFLFSQRD